MNNQEILALARECWEAMAPARAARRRHTRFTYGDQWGDPATDHRGRRVTEGALAAVGGRQPLSNNLIRTLVKSVVGRYRLERSEEAPPAGALAERYARNRLDELDARALEEFLISGMAVQRVGVETRPGGAGAWVDNIAPDHFFISRVRDPRVTDAELVGCLRDMSIRELTARFAPGDPKRAARLRELYGALDGAGSLFESVGREGAVSFSRAPRGFCRVVEVWTLEYRPTLRCHDPLEALYRELPASEAPRVEAENRRRRGEGVPEVDVRADCSPVWRCRWLAPDGTLLRAEDSRLPGGAHPFAVKLYPLIDGEVHSLVEDVIDQQKHVNRLITLMDNMMGAAAKGVLLFPTRCKADGMKWEDITDRWALPGGVIPYNAVPGVEPRQVVTPLGNTGAAEMLQTQIRLFEDVSGVSSALMGKSVSAAVGAERYESEVRNASVAINDLLSTFRDFIALRDKLLAGA